MKSPAIMIAALATILLLSGCIFPGEYWGGRHHDRGGDYRGGDQRDGGHGNGNGHHRDDRGDH